MWLANRLFPSVRRLQARLAEAERRRIEPLFQPTLPECTAATMGGSSPLLRRLSGEPEIVAIPFGCGYIDWVHLAICLFRVSGWSGSSPFSEVSLLVNGKPLEALNCFKTYRPDVAEHLEISNRFRGFGIEYLLPAGETILTLCVNDIAVYSATGSIPEDPVRRGAFAMRSALTRDQVYLTTCQVLKRAGSSLPPSPEQELLALLDGCDEPVLDFGCGAGSLIQALRSRGLDVRGTDMHSMEPFVSPEIKDRVTFYDGICPVPFQSGEFSTVVCNQVLEHIADYPQVLKELARLTSDRLVVAVPDHSVFRITQPFNLIPLHYLIGDHYNFFNQPSLVLLLKALFRSVEVMRISMFQIEGRPIYESLLVDCRK